MYNTTKLELLQVETPKDTRTWKPVGHKQIIETTLESIDKAGFIIDREYYTSARDGKQANGRYTIRNVVDNEMKLQIGFQNSVDKSLSIKYAIGSQVIICSNGMCIGDRGNFKRKHVGDIQEFSPIQISELIK